MKSRNEEFFRGWQASQLTSYPEVEINCLPHAFHSQRNRTAPHRTFHSLAFNLTHSEIHLTNRQTALLAQTMEDA